MYIVYSIYAPARIQHTYRLHKYAVYSICTCTGNIAYIQVAWDQGGLNYLELRASEAARPTPNPFTYGARNFHVLDFYILR